VDIILQFVFIDLHLAAAHIFTFWFSPPDPFISKSAVDLHRIVLVLS
jgi:hypothetical protein